MHRRITAKTEQREKLVRETVGIMPGPLKEQRTGSKMCVEDIRGFQEELFK